MSTAGTVLSRPSTATNEGRGVYKNYPLLERCDSMKKVTRIFTDHADTELGAAAN